MLGQTMGAAIVALVFGYAGPTGGTSPSVAILLAAGFAAFAALVSLCRLLNVLRLPRPPRRRDSIIAAAAPRDMTVHSPAE